MDYLIGEEYRLAGHPFGACQVLTLHLAQFLEVLDGLGQVTCAAEALSGLLVVAGEGVVHAKVVQLFCRSREVGEEISVVSVVSCGQITGDGVEAAHGCVGEETLCGVEHATTFGATFGELLPT